MATEENPVKRFFDRKLTDNLVAYQDWLMNYVDLVHTFKNSAERDAFILGARIGLRSYKAYQESKPTSEIAQRRAKAAAAEEKKPESPPAKKAPAKPAAATKATPADMPQKRPARRARRGQKPTNGNGQKASPPAA